MHAILDTCLANSKATGTDKLVLLIMARASNILGYTQVPPTTIAQLCGKSEQHVREAIKRLSDTNEIYRVQNGGGRNKSTIWRIALRRAKEMPDLKMLPRTYERVNPRPWISKTKPNEGIPY